MIERHLSTVFTDVMMRHTQVIDRDERDTEEA